jgi:hypothetical protein
MDDRAVSLCFFHPKDYQLICLAWLLSSLFTAFVF